MVTFRFYYITVWYHSQEVIAMYFKRLTDLREDHDSTQQEIADLLHCHVSVYKRYEKGTREIPVSMLIVLAHHYGVSIDYIVGIADKPEASEGDIKEDSQK